MSTNPEELRLTLAEEGEPEPLAELRYLDSSTAVCYVVAWKDDSNRYQAEPNVCEDFEDALALAAEIASEYPASDPTIIQVLLDPQAGGRL